MTALSRALLVSVFLLGIAAPVLAQPAASASALSHPGSLAAIGGLSAGSSDSGGSLGAALGFDATERVAVEGRAIFMQRGGAHGLELTGTMLFTLARGPKAAPYAAIGGGLYRASFQLGDGRFFGGMSSQFGPGTRFVPIQGQMGFGMMAGGPTFNGDVWTGPWTGPLFTGSQMPMFYANRLGQMTIPASGRWGMRSFTDPALTVGGGVQFDVTERFYIKPDVRALVVFAGGSQLALTTMTVGFGYRF